MELSQTGIHGAYIITPKVFGDSRGWFYETFSQREMEAAGIKNTFVQDNRSFSALKGTLRGLHCQKNPMAQAKLLTCLRGEILDVAVDIREGSPTYKKYVSVVLSGENKKQFFIPAGCLHGFLTLTDDVEVMYKVDNFYSPENDRSIRFDDSEFGIDWGVESPVLSLKDSSAPLFKDSDVHFTFEV